MDFKFRYSSFFKTILENKKMRNFWNFFVETVFSQGLMISIVIVSLLAFVCFRFYKLNFSTSETSESENNGSYKMGLNIFLLILIGALTALYFYFVLSLI